MKIVEWLSPSNSSVNGVALIEVEPGEIADIEQMLRLVDGDSVGHFGISAALISTRKIPEINPARMGHKEPVRQFGFGRASVLNATKRYYKFFVHRD